MHERALRTVLLVQAIEESDRVGELLPLADRTDATRNAARESGSLDTQMSAGLSPATQRFLVLRAERLRERLEVRSPVIRQVLTLAAGASWMSRVLWIASLLVGFGLSSLDGRQRINILAFPLAGLMLWNFIVYATLIFGRIRTRNSQTQSTWLSNLYERWIRSRADSVLRSSARYNAPLAAGLQRFAGEWTAVAHRLLILRAKKLFHICAALVAVGLIVGLYVRGIGLSYDAGWESTFLAPSQVLVLLKILYGPASLLSGIPLPTSAEEVESLRWVAAGGGASAAPWIHLIAWTALIYIVLPRLLMAVGNTLSLMWGARRLAAPQTLAPYARDILRVGGVNAAAESARVIPYAYEPDPLSLTGLERLLSGTLGGTVTLDLRGPLKYGDEEALATHLLQQGEVTPGWHVLLFSLAATPEAENHGTVVAAARDALARSKKVATLLVVVDESPFAARMGADAALEGRLAERRRLWSEFVAGYGLRGCLLDLAAIGSSDAPVDESAQTLIRNALS